MKSTDVNYAPLATPSTGGLYAICPNTTRAQALQSVGRDWSRVVVVRRELTLRPNPSRNFSTGDICLGRGAPPIQLKPLMELRYPPGFSLKVTIQGGGDRDHCGITSPRGLMAETSDAHFRLDRSLNKYGLPPTTSLGTFLRRRLIPHPRLHVKLAGGIVVFCDPSNCLRLYHGWKVAVGIHPKK